MEKIQIGRTIYLGIKILKDNPVIWILIIISTVLMILSNLIEQTFLAKYYDFLMFFIHIFLLSMVVKMVYDATERKVSIKEAAKLVTKRYIFLLGAGILYILIVGGGLLALIIPGIFLAIKLFFYDYLILLDNKGIIESLKESWRITKGNFWKIMGLNLSFFGIGLLADRKSVV